MNNWLGGEAFDIASSIISWWFMVKKPISRQARGERGGEEALKVTTAQPLNQPSDAHREHLQATE